MPEGSSGGLANRVCLGSYRSTPHNDHGMSWERVSSRLCVIGPFRVGRVPARTGVPARARAAWRAAVVTLSPPGAAAVVSRKTSAARRRSKAA